MRRVNTQQLAMLQVTAYRTLCHLAPTLPCTKNESGSFFIHTCNESREQAAIHTRRLMHAQLLRGDFSDEASLRCPLGSSTLPVLSTR